MKRRLRQWLERAWDSPPGTPPPFVGVLDLLSRGYALAIRRQPCACSPPIPVVSVGSIRVGGAGKTPLASEVARLLEQIGERPAIVLRGYGGGYSGAALEVPRDGCEAGRFGDEACLHARRGIGRVYVARRRMAGVERCHSDGCTVAVLDDGMQHRSIRRALEIVTLPQVAPLANGRLLPRGPLRESPRALARADLLVVSHASGAVEAQEAIAALRPHLRPGTPILAWSAALRVEREGGRFLPPARVGLLCGIARPDSFRMTVATAGYEIAWMAAYADHHRFTPEELAEVTRRAESERLDAVLTTEKDSARMATTAQGLPAHCAVAHIDLVWIGSETEETLRSRLRRITTSAGG